jgi:hypothetical protein
VVGRSHKAHTKSSQKLTTSLTTSTAAHKRRSQNRSPLNANRGGKGGWRGRREQCCASTAVSLSTDNELGRAGQGWRLRLLPLQQSKLCGRPTPFSPLERGGTAERTPTTPLQAKISPSYWLPSPQGTFRTRVDRHRRFTLSLSQSSFQPMAFERASRIGISMVTPWRSKTEGHLPRTRCPDVFASVMGLTPVSTPFPSKPNQPPVRRRATTSGWTL